MNSTNIIIPDVECMSTEQYNTLIDFLDNCPIGYEIWVNEK